MIVGWHQSRTLVCSNPSRDHLSISRIAIIDSDFASQPSLVVKFQFEYIFGHDYCCANTEHGSRGRQALRMIA